MKGIYIPAPIGAAMDYEFEVHTGKLRDLLPRHTDKPIWHYTRSASDILASGAIWANASTKQNDAAELRYGCALVADVWRNIPGHKLAINVHIHELISGMLDGVSTQGGALLYEYLEDMSTASGSLAADSHLMWRLYGSSHAVLIDPRVELQPVIPRELADAGLTELVSRNGMPWAGTWYPVIYDVPHQRELARAAYDRILEVCARVPDVGDPALVAVRSCMGLISTLVAIFKHPDWQYEQEVRCLAPMTRLYDNSGDPHWWNKLDLLADEHDGAFGLTKHYSLTSVTGETPFTEVVCAPGAPDCNSHEWSNGLPVRASERVPVRRPQSA